MTKRTCHFHDGCAWPEQYGDPISCSCRRLKLGQFINQPPSRNERAWLLVAIVWAPLVILAALILWSAA